MSEKWITRKNEKGESKHIRVDTGKKSREKMVNASDLPENSNVSTGELERQAWAMLGDLSKITNVDQLLLQMKKYSGTLGDYSGFNSLLIYMQNKNATIVRSANEWKYFGRDVKDGETPISVLYPLGIPSKTGAGKIKDFIEKKRKEGLDDETIEQLVSEKFNLGRTGTAYVFGTGKVYDISQTQGIPGKMKTVEEAVRATTLYNTLKKIAMQHYTVKEGTIVNGARGYTAHSGEGGGGQKIVVMKIPGEDENVLHTLIHEISHARLEHLYREDLPRGLAESEAELSTYIVGAHFGFDFKDDSGAYIKGWLDDARSHGKDLGKENLDRVLNNARWLINEISGKL